VQEAEDRGSSNRSPRQDGGAVVVGSSPPSRAILEALNLLTGRARAKPSLKAPLNILAVEATTTEKRDNKRTANEERESRGHAFLQKTVFQTPKYRNIDKSRGGEESDSDWPRLLPIERQTLSR